MSGKPRTTDSTTRIKAAFVEALRKDCNVSACARLVGTDRSIVYRWRKEDEDFAQAWDEAVDEALDDVEATVLDLGRGYMEPVYWRDQVIGQRLKYNPLLLMFWLKGKRPEVWREGNKQAEQDIPDKLAPPSFD